MLTPLAPLVPEAVCGSGVAELDKALGTDGWPQGRLVELFGSAYATQLGLRAAACVQANDHPHDRGKGCVCVIDAAQTLDIARARQLGVDMDRLLVSQPDTVEQALEIIETLARSGAVDLVVVDQLDALMPPDDSDVTAGLRVRQVASALRTIAGVCLRTWTTVLFTGLGGSGYSATALRFYASQRVDVRAHVEAGETMLRAKVTKNKFATPFAEVVFPLRALNPGGG